MRDGSDKIINGDNKNAIKDFTSIINLDKNNCEAYYNRANAEFNLRQSKDALADYNKAIELKPDYADAFYNRAFLKQYLNDKNGACNDWNKAVALGKKDVKDLMNICN